MAFLINDLQAGGAGRLVKDLVIEIRGYKDVATTVIVANPIKELISDLKDSGVTIVSCGTSISTLPILHATWQLCQVLQDQEIVVMCSHLLWNPCPVLNDFNSDETNKLVKTKPGEVVAA